MYVRLPQDTTEDSCLHLLAAVDQTLLRRRDALLLLDALLYALDLSCFIPQSAILKHILCVLLFPLVRAYLVVGLDVQLDLLAGECSDPVIGP